MEEKDRFFPIFSTLLIVFGLLAVILSVRGLWYVYQEARKLNAMPPITAPAAPAASEFSNPLP